MSKKIPGSLFAIPGYGQQWDLYERELLIAADSVIGNGLASFISLAKL